MPRHRDFTAIGGPSEPLSFTLSGKRASTGEPWEETFKCWPKIAPQAMADLALAMRVTPEGERVWNAAAIIGFIRRALMDVADPMAEPVPDGEEKPLTEKQRWYRLCNDSDRALDLTNDLGPILLWLAEEYSDRPTQPPST